MNVAIEIAGYTLGATILFGLVILGFFVRAYLAKPRGMAPFPVPRELPNQALQEAQAVLQQVRSRMERAGEEDKEALDMELRRLENRLYKLEQQTFTEQQPYLEIVRQRERIWKKWKDLHDGLTFGSGKLSPENREKLLHAERSYWAVHRRVEEERHTAVARDLINLESLRGQDVLESSAGQGASMLTNAEEEAEQTGQESAPEQSPPAPQTAPATGLHQADLANADLPKSGLRYLDPSIDLSALAGGILQNADLSGVSFAGVLFKGLHAYQNCDFAGADFSATRFESQQHPHRFLGCNLSGCNFAGSHLTYLLFSGCDVSNTLWAEAVLDRVKFVDCRLDGAAWNQVDLSRTIMAADLAARLDFSEAAAPPRIQAPAAPRAPRRPPGATETEPEGGEAPDTPEPTSGEID
ncbi:MAG: pentapeptide repeat-containing protein [SAR324 cluster bacterium]|nr:pentapeptide repeat-containing protein [SAR324 cluster bacterium]